MMTGATYLAVSWLLLFDAIERVETGGHPDPTNALGDNGQSVGPFQIQGPYQTDSEVAGDVRDRRVARQVMFAYWLRYVPRAVRECDLEVLARVHNGGPRGHQRAGTLKYWLKVKKHTKGR